MLGNGYEDELLIRKFGEINYNQTSVVVPFCLRIEILHLAHDSVFAGHLGIAATKKIFDKQIYMAWRHKRHFKLCQIV